MTVHFDQVGKALSQRLSRLDSAFDRHLFAKDTMKNIDKYSLQEGLISALWQSWGVFCKDILFGTIKGAITVKGHAVAAHQYSAYSDLELYYIAKLFGENKACNQVKLSKPQGEPTWGDVSKLGYIFTMFNVHNAQNISVSVSASSLLQDLQVFRNVNAHINAHTISTLNATKIRYSDTTYKHPSDVMFWVDPSSKDFLWKSWVDEILFLSSIMVE